MSEASETAVSQEPEQGSNLPSRTYKFKEPLVKDRMIIWLILAMIGGYGLTFGLQDLAHIFHNQALQKVADFFFYGGMMTKAVWHGQIWRPLTAVFLHGGMYHLFGNAINFVFLALYCRIAFARRGWQVIFFSAAIIGALATILIEPDVQAVGASIGIMGLFGALIAAEIRKRKIDKKKLPSTALIPLSTLVMLLMIQMVVEHLIPNVSHTGHLCGILVGFVLGFVLPLNAGICIVASRAGVVQITGTERKSVTVKGKKGADLVEKVSFRISDNQPGDFVTVVQDELGSERLRRLTAIDLVGESPAVLDLQDEKLVLVASRFDVPSVDSLPVTSEKGEPASEAKEPQPEPIWQRAAGWLIIGYCWYYLYGSWSHDMIMPRESLAWLHFLPDVLANPAISLGSILGALIVTFFAAQLIGSIISSILLGFLRSFLNGALAKKAS